MPTQSARVPGVRRDLDLTQRLLAHVAHDQARRDAATLRAAAAILEVRAQTAPHLVALANRLLALAAQLQPDPNVEHAHEWVDDTNYGDPARRYVCTGCPETKTEPFDQED